MKSFNFVGNRLAGNSLFSYLCTRNTMSEISENLWNLKKSFKHKR